MFLPFGAALSRTGEVAIKGAATDQDVACSTDVLPIVHDGLRMEAASGTTVAVAVCEWVKITPEGNPQTDAIKVLVEHVRGLCVAFYLPCHRRLFRGWQFGEIMAVPAKSEIGGWGDTQSR